MKNINYKEIAKRYLTRIKDVSKKYGTYSRVFGYYSADGFTYVMDGCSYIRMPESVFIEVLKPYFDGLTGFYNSAENMLKSLIDQSKKISFLFNYEKTGFIDSERYLLNYGGSYKVIANKYIKPYLKYEGLYYAEPATAEFSYNHKKTTCDNGTKTPLLIVDSNYEIIAYILPINTNLSYMELLSQVQEYKKTA